MHVNVALISPSQYSQPFPSQTRCINLVLICRQNFGSQLKKNLHERRLQPNRDIKRTRKMQRGGLVHTVNMLPVHHDYKFMREYEINSDYSQWCNSLNLLQLEIHEGVDAELCHQNPIHHYIAGMTWKSCGYNTHTDQYQEMTDSTQTWPRSSPAN